MVGYSTTASRYAIAQDDTAVQRWLALLNDLRAGWLTTAPARQVRRCERALQRKSQ